MSKTAQGSFEVKILPLTFEGQAEDSCLSRKSITKTITGDLVATTQGQMLSAVGLVSGSAGYVAIERVQGTLGGRDGSFVLQHTGTMAQGKASLTVMVVPDSGTGGLQGLTGEFKISMSDGQHGYEFDYELPEAAGEQTSEAVKETASEPTADPAKEAASDSVAEPAKEPASEPAGEPASDPAKEPAAEAAPEAASEPSDKPASPAAG